MNILDTIKAERAKLDAAVDAAIAQRNAFILSIADVAGQPTRRKGNRRVSEAAKRKQSVAAKARWARVKKAGKNRL